MEDELKQQRSTNQQKRALEDQKAQKESLLQPKVTTLSGVVTAPDADLMCFDRIHNIIYLSVISYSETSA